MKTLVICRHAKSDWEQDLSDFDRPLNARGLRDAPLMGAWLHQAGFKADRIISSPANRAISTAKIIAGEIGYAQPIQLEPGFYDSHHRTVLDLIHAVESSVNTLMIFGHNPTFENLGAILLESHGGLILPTSGMICLEAFVHSWRELGAQSTQLKWFITPKTLGRD